MKRKICVFTGARSEYGLLKPLMDEFKKDKSFKLQVIVSGMHLSPEFGLTYREIEKDGFKIDERVETLLSSDTHVGLSKSFGLGVISLSETLDRLKPDMVVVFGDRYEAMAMAIAAMIARIPIVHLSGGEAAEGVIDEQIRHCITKMSHVHFTSMEFYRRKVIQLGEDPKRVFRVGAIGLDNIRQLKLLSKRVLEKQLGLKLKKKNLLITFHPLTVEKNVTQAQFKNVLAVLDELEETQLIFTKANADTGGRVINRMIDQYVAVHLDKAAVYVSLGPLQYL